MEAALILLCAGKGTRMQQETNKMLLNIEGKPLVIHSIEAWQTQACISSIVLVIAAEDQEEMTGLLKQYQLEHVIDKLVIGGKERQDSVYQGLSYLQTLDHPPENVLIHDGARPFIFELELEKLLAEVSSLQSAIFGLPVSDTIKRVNQQGEIKETLNRAELWAIQTPQGFNLQALMQAHQQARKKQLQATDDAALMEWFGQSVKVVEGSKYNLKLTTPEDIFMAQYIYRIREGREECK